MRWSSVGLVSLGVVAAVAAALLMVSFRGPVAVKGEAGTAAPSSPKQVDIYVAAHDLPAMKVVTSADVVKKVVSSEDMPKGRISSAVNVIGRVLVTPMVKEQVFRKEYFASESGGVHLSAALADGKRAVSVYLDEDSRLAGLLYPGSVVDVLASFKLPTETGSSMTQPVSTTILQSVQVLAIEKETVISAHDTAAQKAKKPKTEKEKSTSRLRRKIVTLLVDLEQAEALQLAGTYGKISLALRNPMDMKEVSPTAIRLSEILHQMDRSKQMAAARPAASTPTRRTESMRPSPDAMRTQLRKTMETPLRIPLKKTTQPPRRGYTQPTEEEMERWQVEVIRGSKRDKQDFPMDEMME